VGGIFINYRGADSHAAAELLDRDLAAAFGRGQVFLDCYSIPVGADYARELLDRVRGCGVLLVVIGPRWLTITTDAGARRIDDPGDWIHREIAEALDAGVRVVPVLLDDARLPLEHELPRALGALSRCQAVIVRHRHTESDVNDLIFRLRRAEPALRKMRGPEATRRRRLRRGAWTAGLLTAVTATVVAVVVFGTPFQPVPAPVAQSSQPMTVTTSVATTTPDSSAAATGSVSSTSKAKRSAVEQAAPLEPPPETTARHRRTVTLVRYHNAAGIRLSATSAIAIPSGFTVDTRLGALLQDPDDNTQKVFACQLTGDDGHRFTSNDPTGACEGQTTIALLGYEFVVPPKEHYVPFFRCYTSDGRHFDSVTIDCEGNHSTASGYLLP
jgi:hypothetical protein